MHATLQSVASLLTPWPDGIDATLTLTYVAVIFGIPAFGYILMVLDFRRYLRSLRRALAIVAHAVPAVPRWAVMERPACLRALDLKLPCSESDVMAAYRAQAMRLHPDRGGDLQQFLKLQKHVEQALQLVRRRESGD